MSYSSTSREPRGTDSSHVLCIVAVCFDRDGTKNETKNETESLDSRLDLLQLDLSAVATNSTCIKDLTRPVVAIVGHIMIKNCGR